jgi:hypothetical protein
VETISTSAFLVGHKDKSDSLLLWRVWHCGSTAYGEDDPSTGHLLRTWRQISDDFEGLI